MTLFVGDNVVWKCQESSKTDHMWGVLSVRPQRNTFQWLAHTDFPKRNKLECCTHTAHPVNWETVVGGEFYLGWPLLEISIIRGNLCWEEGSKTCFLDVQSFFWVTSNKRVLFDPRS